MPGSSELVPRLAPCCCSVQAGTAAGAAPASLRCPAGSGFSGGCEAATRPSVGWDAAAAVVDVEDAGSKPSATATLQTGVAPTGGVAAASVGAGPPASPGSVPGWSSRELNRSMGSGVDLGGEWEAEARVGSLPSTPQNKTGGRTPPVLFWNGPRRTAEPGVAPHQQASHASSPAHAVPVAAAPSSPCPRTSHARQPPAQRARAHQPPA